MQQLMGMGQGMMKQNLPGHIPSPSPPRSLTLVFAGADEGPCWATTDVVSTDSLIHEERTHGLYSWWLRHLHRLGLIKMRWGWLGRRHFR